MAVVVVMEVAAWVAAWVVQGSPQPVARVDGIIADHLPNRDRNRSLTLRVGDQKGVLV